MYVPIAMLFVYLLEAEIVLQLIWKHFSYHHHFHTDYENPSVETKSTEINDNSKCSIT